MKVGKLVGVLACLLQMSFSYGQLGGNQSFEFLNLPVGARAAGLGGVIVSSTSSDINLFMSNPALLDSTNHNHASWSYFPFYAHVNYNTLAYAYNFDKIGLMSIGVQHLGYGEFDGYDEAGESTGNFKASETAIVVSKSHQLSIFRLGLSMKFVNGHIDTYSSSALAFDIGGTFIHPDKELSASLLFKNAGFILSDFTGSEDSSLPFDVQVGVTFKPDHMPFRLTATIYNLSQPKFFHLL